MRNLATRTPPSPHVMSFRNLKKEMNRALHLEKRLHVLILQVKKLETTLNQVESFLASSNVLTGTTSLASVSTLSLLDHYFVKCCWQFYPHICLPIAHSGTTGSTWYARTPSGRTPGRSFSGAPKRPLGFNGHGRAKSTYA